MDKDELLALRQEIVNKTREIAIHGNIEPEAKLEVLMNLVQSGDRSQEVLQQAYEITQSLPDDTEKLDSYLDIIYAIDEQLVEDQDPDETDDDDIESESDHISTEKK